MVDPSADELILRALQEDRAAFLAASEEAKLAHQGIARELRSRAARIRSYQDLRSGGAADAPIYDGLFRP